MSSTKENISGRQIAAARELLGITQGQLAEAAGLHRQVLARIEAAKVVPRTATLAKIRDALERRGITFSNGDKPCVCLDYSKAVIPA